MAVVSHFMDRELYPFVQISVRKQQTGSSEIAVLVRG